MTPWIKVRADIFEDPRVLNLSDICRTEVEHTVGLLVRFWSWADRHTADGTGLRITTARIDRLVNCLGFGSALLEIGWLEGTEGDYTIPRFLRHNGESAKARALESEAKDIRRNLKKLSDKCPTTSPENVRPEKRREEKSILVHSLPAGEPEAEAVIEEGRALPQVPPPGFPEKATVITHCEKQGWDVKSGLAFWLHFDQARSNGTPISANWHWWSRLETWVMNDAQGVGRAPASTAARRPAKATINNYDRPQDWTEDQINLHPSKA